MKFRKNNTSLGSLLTVAFLFFAVLLLFLMICMDWYAINTYQMASRQQKTDALEDTVEQVQQDMQQINYTLYEVYENNEDFQALTGNLTELELFSHTYDLNEALKMRLVLEDHLHGYFIFYNNGKSVRRLMDSDIVDSEDVTQLQLQVKDYLENAITGQKWRYTTVNGNNYALLLVRKGKASMCMVYRLSNLEQLFPDASKNGYELFFLDTEGMLERSGLAENDQLLTALSGASRQLSRRYGNYYITAYRIGNSGLWLCMRVRVDLFFFMSPGHLLLIFLTFIMALGLLWLRHRMNDYLIIPLQRLVQTMNRVQDGQWEAKVQNADFVEIQKVNDALETMVDEIHKQKIIAYEQTLEKQQTQMRYLQLQLKPHFYLNGLKTLNAMVMAGDLESTQNMIINLSEHMRYLLQSEREVVPLEAEVEFVKNYTQLQKNMTGRIFCVTWDIKPVSRAWLIPTLCIQTFVENSFKYAKMGSVQKELLLRISIRELETESGPYLDICVRDNGCGYPPKVLDSIYDAPDQKLGVGISNLLQRCALLYGGKAEYNFYNDNGAISELSLPWEGR